MNEVLVVITVQQIAHLLTPPVITSHETDPSPHLTHLPKQSPY
jgi:hypothetical protein